MRTRNHTPAVFASALLALALSLVLAVPASAADRATLSVAKSGNGDGAVSGSGINCGGDCSETYDVGTTVTLTAAENATSVFTGWSGGGCSGILPCDVTVNSNTTVTANFVACTITGANYVFGTLGNDVICGGPSHDGIIDLGGDDIISGKGGADVIFGAPGDDFISGGPGNDWMFGEMGNDVMIGGDGSDRAYADIPLAQAPQGTDVCDAEQEFWGCES